MVDPVIKNRPGRPLDGDVAAAPPDGGQHRRAFLSKLMLAAVGVAASSGTVKSAMGQDPMVRHVTESVLGFTERIYLPILRGLVDVRSKFSQYTEAVEDGKESKTLLARTSLAAAISKLDNNVTGAKNWITAQHQAREIKINGLRKIENRDTVGSLRAYSLANDGNIPLPDRVLALLKLMSDSTSIAAISAQRLGEKREVIIAGNLSLPYSGKADISPRTIEVFLRNWEGDLTMLGKLGGVARQPGK